MKTKDLRRVSILAARPCSAANLRSARPIPELVNDLLRRRLRSPENDAPWLRPETSVQNGVGEPGTTNDRGIETGRWDQRVQAGYAKTSGQSEVRRVECAGRSMHVCLDEAMADENETVAPRYH